MFQVVETKLVSSLAEIVANLILCYCNIVICGVRAQTKSLAIQIKIDTWDTRNIFYIFYNFHKINFSDFGTTKSEILKNVIPKRL